MSKRFTSSFLQALLAATLVVVSLAATYFVVEPQVGRAVSGAPFPITQEIGAEISFLVQAATTTMTGPLNGLTGGNATGTTQAVVRANSGYYVEIAFSDVDADGIMMRREGGGSNAGSIRNYSTSTSMTEPSYGFSTASTSAVFAYTVTASDTLAVDQSFLNNGSVCNAGSGTDVDTCWMRPQTSGFRIMNSLDPAPTGATTTVKFRVYIPSSPTPGVDSGFYTATATLSAFTQ